jgi:hypothetical protein
MILSINQPAYLPWLGYFDRIYKSDIHIILDHVQFEKNSMINRNKVRIPVGWTWLTVPVKTKGKFGKLNICELEINELVPWQRKHWNTIKTNYNKANFFEQHFNFFEYIYSQSWNELYPLIADITEYLLNALNIKTRLIRSSELTPAKTKSDLIIELCMKVGATKYISGPFGREYLNKSSFSDNGIELLFHDYQHSEYKQNFKGFEPYMSVIDLLFNHGPESRNILISPGTSLQSF